mgnify:CR=1 FL=1
MSVTSEVSYEVFKTAFTAGIGFTFPAGATLAPQLGRVEPVAQIGLHSACIVAPLDVGGDAEELQKYPSITRTGNAVHEVFRGNLWKNENGLTGMAALYQTVLDGDDSAHGSAPDPAFTAEDLLAALISSEKGERLSIPVQVSEAEAKRQWSIS